MRSRKCRSHDSKAKVEGSGTTLIVPVVYRLLVFQLRPLLKAGKLICEKLPVVGPLKDLKTLAGRW